MSISDITGAGIFAKCEPDHTHCLLIAAMKGISAVVSVMSNFGFEPGDWLFLASGVALAAVITAVLVL